MEDLHNSKDSPVSVQESRFSSIVMVKDLIEQLKLCSETAAVVLSSDDDGNRFCPLWMIRTLRAKGHQATVELWPSNSEV